MNNISIGYLALGMIALFFTTMMFLRQNDEHIYELKKELKESMKCINNFSKDISMLNGKILKNKKELDDINKKLEGSENGIDYADLASHLKGIEGSLKGMLDIVEQEHADTVKWRSEASERQIKAFCEYNDASEDSGDNDKPYADIPGDLDEGFEGEESATDEQREALEHSEKTIKNKKDIPSYHWVFPHEDYEENRPVLGEEYLVVGRERKTGEVVSGIGTWIGIKYDMDEGYKLDKVYAYVRLPSPSDVMNEVLDIVLKE